MNKTMQRKQLICDECGCPTFFEAQEVQVELYDNGEVEEIDKSWLGLYRCSDCGRIYSVEDGEAGFFLKDEDEES